MRPDRLGLIIGAAFGLVYVEVNAGAVPSPYSVILRVLGAVSFAGVLAAVRRAGSGTADGRGGEFGRGYWLVVAAEVAVGVAGIAVLNGPLDKPHADLPWISLVVGVHFLGLARVWRAPALGWLGAGIAALGAIGLGLALDGASEAAVTVVAGVCPGALLLLSSALTAARQLQNRTM